MLRTQSCRLVSNPKAQNSPTYKVGSLGPRAFTYESVEPQAKGTHHDLIGIFRVLPPSTLNPRTLNRGIPTSAVAVGAQNTGVSGSKIQWAIL